MSGQTSGRQKEDGGRAAGVSRDVFPCTLKLAMFPATAIAAAANNKCSSTFSRSLLSQQQHFAPTTAATTECSNPTHPTSGSLRHQGCVVRGTQAQMMLPMGLNEVSTWSTLELTLGRSEVTGGGAVMPNCGVSRALTPTATAKVY